MFKIGDKVRVVNREVQYHYYPGFFKENSINKFLKSYETKFIRDGAVGIVKFIGHHYNDMDNILAVIQVGDNISIIQYDGIELVEESNKSKYGLKRKTIAQKITTDKFEVELWQTDDSYTLYFDKYLMVELLKDEEIDELIYILQEAKKLKQ